MVTRMSAVEKFSKGWDDAQISAWREDVMVSGKKRDYEVIKSQVAALPANTNTVETYATTSDGYPLYRITVGDVNNGNPNILIVGGVHGYEPSGVEASVKFLQEEAPKLSQEFNFVVYPCITPWAYEFDQRWNSQAQDPNRLFARGDKFADIEECRYFMDSMELNTIPFTAAFDLHETPDSDRKLRVLRSERFGTPLAPDYLEIPQGFYMMLTKRDTAGENAEQLLFGQAILDEVKKISPIAPEATMLEGKVNYGGVILAPASEGLTRHYLGKHAGLVAVTEVYPDHKDMSPEKSIDTQIAAVKGGLNYVRNLYI